MISEQEKEFQTGVARRTFIWLDQVAGDAHVPASGPRLAIIFLRHFGKYGWKKGECKLSREDIARGVGLSVRAVQPLINALKERGHLEIVSTRGRAGVSVYRAIVRVDGKDHYIHGAPRFHTDTRNGEENSDLEGRKPPSIGDENFTLIRTKGEENPDLEGRKPPSIGDENFIQNNHSPFLYPFSRQPTEPGEGDDHAEPTWWDIFDENYCWQPTDSKLKTRAVFDNLPPHEQAAAARYAAPYKAAIQASGRIFYPSAAKWLEDRGWQVLADEERKLDETAAALKTRYAGKTWIEADTHQWVAWRRFYNKPLASYDRRNLDGRDGRGRFEASEWPPQPDDSKISQKTSQPLNLQNAAETKRQGVSP